MIVQLRLDDRLIHGQVVTLWSKVLDIDSIVVANDYAAKDELSRQILKSAGRSTGKKIAIRSVSDAITLLSDPRAEKKKVLLICDSPSDALKLVKALPIEDVNICNFIKAVGGDKIYIARFLKINRSEFMEFTELSRLVPKLYSQLIPTDAPLEFEKLLAKARSEFAE